MTDFKAHRCIRCGIEVYQWGTACVDCNHADPVTVNLLRPPPRRVVEVERPDDCPVPTRSGYDRHIRRGEPSCRACAAIKEHGRRPRSRAGVA